MAEQCRKAYVSVNLDVDEDGVIYPRYIRWSNGKLFQIDQLYSGREKLTFKCRAFETKFSRKR